MASSLPLARRTQLTGNRIRERRLVLGMKQADLAEAVGISASYLNLIEHNRRRIGGDASTTSWPSSSRRAVSAVA